MSYYDGYEDYYGSELDSLTDEYLEKVKECFKEDVKNLIEDIKAKEKRNQQKESELRERELNIQKQEKEIALLQDKKDEIVLEFMKKHGLDLQIGQQVYIIQKDNQEIKCPTCHDARKIKVQLEGKEFEIRCPDCGGYKKSKPTYKVVSKYVVEARVYFWAFKKDKYSYPHKIKLQQSELYLDSGYDTVTLGSTPDRADDYGPSKFKRSEIYLTKEDAEKALEEIKEKENK